MPGTRYKIEYEDNVKDNLKKLPKNIQERIIKGIDQRLSRAPCDYGKPLEGQWKGHRRLRVGDYRVIYKIFEERIVVFIVEIDHRKSVYN